MKLIKSITRKILSKELSRQNTMILDRDHLISNLRDQIKYYNNIIINKKEQIELHEKNKLISDSIIDNYKDKILSQKKEIRDLKDTIYNLEKLFLND